METVDILSFTGVKYQPYADFWQQSHEQCRDGFGFRQQLAATDGETPAARTFEGELDPRTAGRMLQLVNHNDAGVFVTLVAGLSALLGKYTRQPFVILDAPPHPGDAPEKAVARRVPLIIPVDEKATWKEHLVKTQEKVRNSFRYQHYPLHLVDRNRPAGEDVYPSSVWVQYNAPDPVPAGSYDWVVAFRREGVALKATISYNPAAFEADFMERAWEHFQELLTNLHQLDRTLGGSSLLPEAERRQLLADFNATPATAAGDAPGCLHALFEAQAARTPDHLALQYQDLRLTYAQLNEAANRLAHCLRETYAVGRDQLVGLMVDRSERMVIGLLAILKAGGAYLPIDPNLPADRKAFMLADAGVTLLLTDSDHLFDVSYYQGELFAMDVQLSGLDTPATNPAAAASPRDLAYTIYTSGSTGTPKGVMIEHGGSANMALDQIRCFGIRPADKVLQFAAFSFDASVSELFMALLTGAAVVLVDKGTIDHTVRFEQFLRQQQITVVTLPPAYLRALDKANLRGLRVLITAGEAAYADDAAACSQFCQYFNAYGPTECSVCVTIHEVRPADPYRSTVPIGRPIANTQVCVLDEAGELAPIGLPGELWVSGPGVARGYINGEATTQEKFTAHPLLPGKRLYRTGDLVKWTADGVLEFVGRRDEQVKLRGYRIEPGEIAATIKQHPGVQEAFVLKTPAEDLLAVVVPHPQRAVVLRELTRRRGNSPALPLHTLPNGLVVYHKNRFETEVLYEEIFRDRVYQRGGIRLPKDAVIIDVGANIGLFSLYAGLQLRGAATIYAFEPVPEIFELLEANAALYQLPIKAFQAGLADVEARVTFTYYPNNTALSGRYGDAQQDMETVRQAIRNRALDGEPLAEASLAQLVEERVVAQRVDCQLRRLSDVIREQDIDRIDLLKIDAEKSEYEVLAGIEEGDWAKIRQLAVEVHDAGGQVAALERRLREQGFRVVVEEGEGLSGTGLFNVYAVREEPDLEDHARELVLNAGEQWTSAEALVEDIKRLTREKLPDYMTPSLVRLVEYLPHTPHGNVDKKALLQLPGLVPAEKQTYVAPRTETERQLAAVWEEVLDRRPIGIHDDFFELGGHSLKATRMVSRIYKTFQVNVELGSVFSHPTVERLAGLVDNSALVSYESIPAVEESTYYALSHAQRRLWILDQFEESRLAYIIPNGYLLHDIDPAVFERAFFTLLERHESLRTTLTVVNGEPFQQIHPTAALYPGFRSLDLRGEADPPASARREAYRETVTPFDLQKGPLLRATLIRLSEEGYLFLLTLHHIISDGWSMHLLVKELTALYAAFAEGRPNPLPPLRIQYKDYAAWQQRRFRSPAFKKYETYWLNRFGGALPALELPTDFPRPLIKSFAGHYVTLVLEGPLSDAFKAFCRERKVSLLMALTALAKALLYRYTAQEDITVGTTVSGRDHADLENQAGFYVNVLALRTQFSGNDSFDELLAKVRETITSGFDHQRYPFDSLVRQLQLRRDTGRSPLFDVLVELLNVNPDGGNQGSIQAANALDEYMPAYTISKYDLSFKFDELAEGLFTCIEYSTRLFRRERVEQMLLHFREMMVQVLADSRKPISRLAYLPAPEVDQVAFAFNQTEPGYAIDRTIVQLFEEQVARTPGATAVVFNDRTYSYRQLNELADRLAQGLAEVSLPGPGEPVGILLNRSEKMVAAVWAVLKTGAAFLFIDPAYPTRRKQYMLGDAGVRLLITSSDFLLEVPDYYAGDLYMVDIQLDEAAAATPVPMAAPQLHHQAYQLYTSGSTGEPKGVQISHGSIANYLAWANHHYFHGRSGYPFPLFTSLSFDLTLTSLLATLLRGDALVVYEEKEIDSLLRAIFGSGSPLRAAKITPSHVNILGELRLGRTKVEKVIVGGEMLQPRHVEILRELNPDIRIYNEYGPTETTVGSTAKEIGAAHEPITIGSPIANTQVYILDDQGQYVPVGVPGEIVIGGKGVALGYRNKPELTAARFVASPAGPARGKVYRTGDVGKWLPGGEIVLLGRKDHQVKLRGYRIELGEIENVLLRGPGVRQAAVLPVAKAGGEVEALAAFVESDGPSDAAALHPYLAAHLPAYMIPTQWVTLEKMPLTTNGKIDRDQLHALRPDGGAPAGLVVAPRNPLEKELAGIWEEVLGRQSVGIQDDFFQLGGHSLTATQIISRVYQKLNVVLDISSIFLHPTIEQLARIVAGKSKTAYAEIPLAGERPYYEILPAQKRLWITEQLTEGLSVYNSCGSYVFEGPLEADLLESVFATLIERHEMLRSSFVTVNGEPKLRVHAPSEAGFRLHYTDLRGEADKARMAERYSAEDARARFDLGTGPLFRVRLLQLEEEQFIVLFTLHHIISDGWSLHLLITEFVTLYGAYRQGQENPLAPLRIQYKDYAQWMHGRLGQEELDRHRAYWQEQFGGELPVLAMPLERPRPRVKTYNGSVYTALLPAHTTAALKALGGENGATLFMTLLAGLKALLYRYTRQEDLVIGTVEAGRNHPDLENQMGIYVNTLALRTRFDASESFGQLLGRVKDTVLGAYEHLAYPFDQLLEDLRIHWNSAHSPLFDVVLSLENTDVAVREGSAPREGTELAEVRVRGFREEVWSSIFDLVVNARELEEGLALSFCYNTDLFSESFIRRFAGHLEGMLKAVVQDPGAPVCALPYLPEAERAALLGTFNDTAAACPDEACMHTLFEAQAARNPDGLACLFHHQALTYRDLNEQANRLAHYLRDEYQVRPGEVVGLMMDKSERVLVGILGILKAGAAYLPIDPAYPQERKMYILSDAAVRVLLLESDYLFDLDGYQGALLAMDVQLEGLTTPAANPPPVNSPADAAYVIYTSGSTGKPKGVVIEHRANVNMSLDQVRRFAVTQADRVLQFASLSFDASVYEIFMGLYAGAAVVMADRKVIQSTGSFVAYLRDCGVSVVTLPPAYLRILDLPALSFLRVVVTAGEAAHVPDAVQCSTQSDYYNAYGPTEAAVCVSTYRVGPGDQGRERIPIGLPIANTQLHVLDQHGQLVPVGVEGELCISGAGLARGYLNRPELTSEKFVAHPLLPGARMYKTGDVCKRLEDGTIDFVGRNDHQVKLRGFRIELGEIAAVIRGHEAVEDACVLLQEETTEKKLLAFITPDPTRAYALAQRLRAAAEGVPRLHTLPNGLVVSQMNRAESDVLYEEIFLERHYVGKGIVLQPGDVVFDVGANIGMFSLFAGLHYPGVQLFAFEPLAPVFGALQHNVRLYDLNAQVFNYGLSDENKQVSFTYYTHNTALSSQYADHGQDRELVRNAILNKAREEGQELADEHLEALVSERLQIETQVCRLRRLSDVIREQAVTRIDLLKIDVEKSEWEVIRGIGEADWAKIRQLVIEVYDIGGRLAQIEALLREKGYQYRVEQEGALENTGLYMVYAARPVPAAVAAEPAIPALSPGQWPDEAALVEDVGGYCRQQLPEYMLPARTYLLSRIPLTVHGKVDKEALLKMAAAAAGRQPAQTVPPRTRLEKQLAAIWENVLHREGIGVTDHFFEVGGNSLKAAQIAARLYKELNVRLDLAEVFQHPTIADLAALVAGAERVVYEPIPPAPPARYYALSHAQRRILIETRLEQTYKVYNIAGGYFFEQLDREAFEKACRQLVGRHEILRTTFVNPDGEEYRQQVHPADAFAFRLDCADASQEPDQEGYVQQLLRQETTLAFDLERGPLFRARLLALGQGRYAFLFTVHHIIFDAQSMRIVIREILSHYEAYRRGQPLRLSPLRVQYKDYAEWQQTQLRGEHLEHHRAYWLGQFGGAIPVLELPTDFTRPALKTFRGSSVALALGEDLTEALETLALGQGASLFVALQAALHALLYRFTNQTDLVLGIAEAGRDHPDLETQIGFYVNTLALRTRFAEGDSFSQLLEKVKETTLDAYRHLVYPFDKLVEELHLTRDTSRSPLFDVGLLYEDLRAEEGAAEGAAENGITAQLIGAPQTTSQLDLKFAFARLDRLVAGEIVYNADLFEAQTVRYWQDTFLQLVALCVAHPATPLQELAQRTRAAGRPEVTIANIEEVDF